MRGSYLCFVLWLTSAATFSPGHGPFITGSAEAASVPNCAGLAPHTQGKPARPTSVSDLPKAGVPSGAAVLHSHNGTLTITEADSVIDGWDITGNVIVKADNVTIKNTTITANSTYHALDVWGAGFTLEDSRIDGSGTTDNAVQGMGLFLRNDLSDAEHGINVTGPSVIRDNFIHDLHSNKPDPHYDGIFIGSGHEIEIIGNTIVNNQTQTSAIMMQNVFGAISDITIDGNRLSGGGFTIYLDKRHGDSPIDDATVCITNNIIGKGYYGHTAFELTHPIYSGNAETGNFTAGLR